MSVRIVGAGPAGINVLDEWILLSDCPAGSLACDGDAPAVEGSLASEKLLLAPDLVGGLGCFGCRDLAWRVVGQESRRLDAVLKDCTRLLIVTGLAGATGATVAEALSLKAVQREIPTTVFAFPPFPFEGEQRREAAEAARNGLPVEVSLFLFPSPALSAVPLPGVAAVRRGLREFHAAVARWVDVWSGMARGSVRILPHGGGTEAPPFGEGGEIENCRVFGEAGARLDLSLLRFLEGSEFRQAAEKADRCLVYVEGAEEMPGWDGELTERLQEHLPKGTRLCLLRRNETLPMDSRLFLLVGRAASRHPKSMGSERGEEEPSEAPVSSRALPEPEGRLVHTSVEGTPFAKTAATLHKGENLDIPAFRRRRGNPLAAG